MVSTSGWPLGALFELLAGEFIGTSSLWQLQGTAALPSLWKGYSSIAAWREQSEIDC